MNEDVIEAEELKEVLLDLDKAHEDQVGVLGTTSPIRSSRAAGAAEVLIILEEHVRNSKPSEQQMVAKYLPTMRANMRNPSKPGLRSMLFVHLHMRRNYQRPSCGLC